MAYSFLLFVILLSAQQVYGELLASKEWLTIVGGFISSLLFLLCLTVHTSAVTNTITVASVVTRMVTYTITSQWLAIFGGFMSSSFSSPL